MTRFETLIVTSFAAVALLLGADIIDDLHHGADLSHVMLEAVAFLVSAGIFAGYSIQLTRQILVERKDFTKQLQILQIERDRWRQQAGQYLAGLSQAIQQQFDTWKLTKSEQEIALLILKGLSHKEIAQIRNTSERTVRQQATCLYAKAKLESKAQLSAFFLEDLMLPNGNSGTL